MTNEWNEYKAYIGQPTYTVSNGKDTTFLGRFTTEMIKDFKGFARIFTILARGIFFTMSTERSRTEIRVNVSSTPDALSVRGAVCPTKRKMPLRLRNGNSRSAFPNITRSFPSL